MTKVHDKMKAWREKRGLSLEQLSELTGYSVPAIYAFERGNRRPNEGHSEWTVQRYRMACAGAEAQLKTGRRFEW